MNLLITREALIEFLGSDLKGIASWTAIKPLIDFESEIL